MTRFYINDDCFTLNQAQNDEYMLHYNQIEAIISEIKEYLNEEFLKYPYATDLDRCRVKQINSLLDTIEELLTLMIKLVSKFKGSKSNENFRFYIELMFKNSVYRIQKLSKEPFSHFPDMSIWLLANNEPVGVCNLRASNLIWSTDARKRGKICGKLIYTDIKSIREADFDKPETENIARVRIYPWLGGFDETGYLFEPETIPTGFDVLETNDFGLPIKLFYRGKN